MSYMMKTAIGLAIVSFLLWLIGVIFGIPLDKADYAMSFAFYAALRANEAQS